MADQNQQAPQPPPAFMQQPLPLPQLMQSSPGIMKDGTRLQKSTYIDGLWCRFYQDKPRKILGYQEQLRNVNGIVRKINIFNTSGYCYVHTGTTQALQRYAIQLNTGINTGLIDRTPSGYVANPTNLWQTDTVYLTSGGTAYLFAAATPSLSDITNNQFAPVYYGDVLLTTPLQSITTATFTATIAGNVMTVVGSPAPTGNISIGNLVSFPGVLPNTSVQSYGTGTGGAGTYILINTQTVAAPAAMTALLATSGGLVGVGPYLFLYGHDGLVQWSAPGFPSTFTGVGSGNSRPVSDKIVVGLPLRGQSAPAVILWSLSSLIVGNFVGGDTIWNFSAVDTSGSILSANSVVMHNGIYYWATTSGFSQFSGVMQDIPNEFNKDYFLTNLNFQQRQKVFVVKVPRWNEIWWYFPFGNSTECNHAVIYNYAKNYWYDTPAPNGGRAAGVYNTTYSFPILSGVTTNSDTGGTSMWQHEFGLDEVSGPQSTAKAIDSYIETQEFSLAVPSQPGSTGVSKSLAFSTLEPDFNQVGDLTMEVYSRANARAPFESPTDANYPYVIPANPATPQEQLVDFKWSGRLTSFLIESNTLGGNYIWGSPLMHLKPSDGRRTG